MKNVVSSRLRRGTRLIDLSVKYNDPEQACRLAEAVVNTYIQGGIKRRLDIMGQANKVLSDEAEVLRAKLQTSEEALQNYMEKHNAVSLEDTQNIVVDQLKQINMDTDQGHRGPPQSGIRLWAVSKSRKPTPAGIAFHSFDLCRTRGG